MTQEDVAGELARLREDVAALKAARASSGADREPAPIATEPTDRREAAEGASAPDETGDGEHDLKSQLDELGDLLHEELKEMPAVTSLAVFSLGILLGRFLR